MTVQREKPGATRLCASWYRAENYRPHSRAAASRTERTMKRILGVGALLAVLAAVARVVMGRRRDAEDEA